MEKVIKDGKVAVLISHGFGAGWYTWGDSQELLFNPKLVEMVQKGKANEITKEWVKENIGIDVYCGGAKDLKIHWLESGTAFVVEEYDGAESLRTLDNLTIVA